MIMMEAEEKLEQPHVDDGLLMDAAEPSNEGWPSPLVTERPFKWYPAIPRERMDLRDAVSIIRMWEERLTCSLEEEGWLPVGNAGPILIITPVASMKEANAPNLPLWAYQAVDTPPDKKEASLRSMEEARTNLSKPFSLSGSWNQDENFFKRPRLNPNSDAMAETIHRYFHWWMDSLDPHTESGVSTIAATNELLRRWLSDPSVLVADPRTLNFEASQKFPKNLIQSYGIYALFAHNDQAYYATARDSMELRDHLADFSPSTIYRPVFSLEEDIEAAIKGANYDSASAKANIGSKKRPDAQGDSEELAFEFDSSVAATVDPEKKTTEVTEIFRYLLNWALEAEVSDVHIQYSEGRGRVRFRMDGELRDVLTMDRTQARALAAVIKDCAKGMESNNYNTQDGTFTFRRTDKLETVNVRVSAIPHLAMGQKLVMRILPKRNRLVKSLDTLQMSELNEKVIRRAINRKQGIILVTGPTGSGKTTTLYNCLSATNKPGVSIQTIEDPCEIVLEGVNQTQVDLHRNLTIPAAMRAVVRQDPDIILVGEIRDAETASLAVDAALTGHLVYSTMHSIDPVAALDRLIKLGASRGVTHTMIAQSVLLIQAQRLIKALCPNCKRKGTLSESEKEIFRRHDRAIPEKIYKANPNGCSHCAATGYSGRRVIMEIMPSVPEIVEEIAQECRPWVIRKLMEKRGFRKMIDDGLRIVAEGDTDIDQVLQYEDAWSVLDDENDKGAEE